MKRSSSIQKKLEELCSPTMVYFQPPNNIQLTYPAVVYEINQIENSHADDSVYAQRRSYTITVMHKTPDSDLTDIISTLPTCRHDRSFVINNLYHDVFTIYDL